MQSSKYQSRVCILIIFAFVLAISQAKIISCEDGLELLSKKEAEQLKLTDEEWEKTKPVLRGPISDGPIITLKNPALKDASVDPPSIETNSPFDLVVIFKENSAPVDMNSLEVIGKKGFLKMSLTERLKPYIKGTTLGATHVIIPKGKFRIEVSIKDVNGIKTDKSYRIQID